MTVSIALAAAAFAGLAAGAVHVLAGADHLAAVAPLAGDGRCRAWRAGLRWGVGHAAGVAVVGAAALVLRDALPLDAVGGWSERLVGAGLVGLGAWVALAAIAGLGDGVAGPGHAHPHGRGHGRLPHGRGRLHRHPSGERAALVFGVLHGTAGVAHLLGVLPALALGAPAAAAYLAGFSLGTIGAMTLFAALMGEVGRRFARAGRRAYAGAMATWGVASIGVGAYWLLP